MKAYSVDLRQKILETYKNKEGSIRQVAERFKVSRSFVQKLLKQHQQMGSLAPLPHGGGTPPKLTDYVLKIEKLLEEKNDATLPELCQNLKEGTGISVSPSTLCRFLQKLNLTRKKNFSGNSSIN
jgi:transposase